MFLFISIDRRGQKQKSSIFHFFPFIHNKLGYIHIYSYHRIYQDCTEHVTWGLGVSGGVFLFGNHDDGFRSSKLKLWAFKDIPISSIFFNRDSFFNVL